MVISCPNQTNRWMLPNLLSPRFSKSSQSIILFLSQYSAGQGVMIQVNGTQGGESQFWPAPMPKQSANNDSVNTAPRPSTITLHIGSPGVPTVTTYIEAVQGPPEPVHSELYVKASAFRFQVCIFPLSFR